MTAGERIVIVGAGLAGDTACAELRAIGWTGPITMIGDEPEPPYDRPPLSKAVLLDAADERKVFLREAGWYDDNGIDLVLGNGVVEIDRARNRVVLASGDAISYAKLLIATGAHARTLPSLETGAFPVQYLRSLADARRLRAALTAGARVAVIGGGVIGLEVAAIAIQRGCVVTVVEGTDRVMGRIVAPGVSDFLHRYHSERGVGFVYAAQIADTQSQAGMLLLADGTAIAVDLVVAGVGASPNVALAQAARLRVDNGIVVDRHTRTSDPDIHAAGDVTRFQTADGYSRAENWRHAVDQALVAARVMTGADASYDENCWLWSDQYDLNIQVTGRVREGSDVLRGCPDDSTFILFHLDGDRVVGATSVNQARHKRAVAALIERGAVVDPSVLADTSVDLKKLAAGFAAVP